MNSRLSKIIDRVNRYADLAATTGMGVREYNIACADLDRYVQEHPELTEGMLYDMGVDYAIVNSIFWGNTAFHINGYKPDQY